MKPFIEEITLDNLQTFQKIYWEKRNDIFSKIQSIIDPNNDIIQIIQKENGNIKQKIFYII